ncbi:MAG TPA: 2Fe-2S iron-sulfur cluster-binding protein, partial [Candidatus Bathyarchaeia archaeon]
MCTSDDGLVTVVFEPDGNKIRAQPGTSLLEAAVKAGNRIRSECGGNGKCGKCRVVVKDQGPLTGLTAHERRLLSSPEAERGVRLACQAKVKESVVVFVPPESRVEQRKIQVTGHETPSALDPAVRKLHVVLPRPTLSDARPDLERLTGALDDECGLDELEIDYDLLKRLPRALREADWDITVTVWD